VNFFSARRHCQREPHLKSRLNILLIFLFLNLIIFSQVLSNLKKNLKIVICYEAAILNNFSTTLTRRTSYKCSYNQDEIQKDLRMYRISQNYKTGDISKLFTITMKF
jgi:hypothetical protein